MRTFAMLKPETVRRNLIGEVLRRLESDGFKIVGMKLIRASEEQARMLYEVHKGKPFYDSLIRHITSGPIVCTVLERDNAVAGLRAFIGSTNPAEAKPGTIRRDFGLSMTENAIHASDSPASYEREMAIFFKKEELV